MGTSLSPPNPPLPQRPSKTTRPASSPTSGGLLHQPALPWSTLEMETTGSKVGDRSTSPPATFHSNTSTSTASNPMPEDKLVAQEMYTAYMLAYPRPKPAFEPGGYSPETDPWRDHALAAWLLARLVRDREFEKYSLAQFIQNCALFIFGPWEFIERECRSGSSLRRFADHWVTWNTLLAGGENASHEYTGLKAASRTRKLARGGGEDPRTYALSHWFRDCGDSLDPRCDHVPSVRMEREQRREQRRAREAARKKADEYT
ncbi:hypothetical protein IMZ48_01515, partial [Candidatus Bathyarchaeota archaeon]|nr:hypothetical protein [Candidatus Bathyarchaeota archaeon]